MNARCKHVVPLFCHREQVISKTQGVWLKTIYSVHSFTCSRRSPFDDSVG